MTFLQRATAFTALALPLFAAAPAAAQCTLEGEGRAWIQEALDDWDAAGRELRLDARPLPWMVFIDTACVWHAAADSAGDAGLAASLAPAGAPLRFDGRAVEVRGVAHGGRARLPGGQEVPAAPLSFAAPYGDAGAAFFVIGMPAVWRRSPSHADDPDLRWLVNAVFVHEMTHTRQIASVYRRIDALAARVPDPESLDDDVIQSRFDSVPGFREAIDAERGLLFRAAAEADPELRRPLARQALEAARERRARWFAGGNAAYAELEDVFLGMEGAANWAAYRVALRRAGPDADPAAVLTRFRRGGTLWSQDYGFALFLTLDALLPDWPSRIFAEESGSVFEMLEGAVR